MSEKGKRGTLKRYNSKGGVAPWQNPFADVKSTDWFYGDVEYAVSKSLLSGTGAAIFSPNTAMTRAMLVTALWRMEDKPVGTLDPKGTATRAEAAAMLHRFLENVK